MSIKSRLIQLAARSEKEVGVGNYVVGGAGLYGGSRLMYRGLPMVLGQQRVYHGTSRQNASKIKSEGFKTKYGGINGSSAHVGSASYVKNSTGKIHVTPSKRVASGFATLNGLDKGKSEAEKMLAMIKGVALRSAGDGEVITAHVPYGNFKQNFKIDPDMPGRVAFTTDADIGRSFVGKRSVFHGVSAGSVLRYAKKYPERLAKGVGLGALGAGISVLAARQMRRKPQEK
jgi:hypothetical protein